jgi:hypothetical protein
MLFTHSPPDKGADRTLRERIVASIAGAVPANDAACKRLQSLRRSLDRVDSAIWAQLVHLDRAWGGMVEKSVVSHVERIAANASHYTDARAVFAAFLSMNAPAA